MRINSPLIRLPDNEDHDDYGDVKNDEHDDTNYDENDDHRKESD